MKISCFLSYVTEMTLKYGKFSLEQATKTQNGSRCISVLFL